MPSETDPTPRLVPVFIPDLGTLLLHAETEKGTALTEPEVLAIRDTGVCIMMSVDRVREMYESRVYGDLNPENVWEEFLALKRALANPQTES